MKNRLLKVQFILAIWLTSIVCAHVAQHGE